MTPELHNNPTTHHQRSTIEQCLLAVGIAFSLSVLYTWGTRLVMVVARAALSQFRHRLGHLPFRRSDNGDYGSLGVSEGIYGLEHLALNWTWEGGLKSMWMNMGYWKDTASFPQASENLLVYLLQCAGIIDMDSPRKRSINFLDLGFGCGDQTLYITNRLTPNITVKSYIGITLSKVQYEFAKRRVLEGWGLMDILLGRPESQKIAETKPAATPLPLDDNHTKQNIRLYNTDASNPNTWPSSLHLSLLPLSSPPTLPLSLLHAPQKSPPAIEHSSSSTYSLVPSEADIPDEHWTLALDSLYHFRPSRVPILRYTHDKLHSNLLAFDLFRPSTPKISPIRYLFLRAFCVIASIPYHNLLTKEQYIEMLVENVGYHKEDILIQDISEFVFPGLSRFISQRTMEMERLGIKWKYWSGFKAVAWAVQIGLFHGGVVVARWRAGEAVDKGYSQLQASN